jgi:hypothetical protein
MINEAGLAPINRLSVRDELTENPNTTVNLTDGVSEKIQQELSSLVGLVKSRYDIARLARQPHEQRWLRAITNYRGEVNGKSAFIETEISKAFIKITKTKVLAAYGQLLEVLLLNDRIPIDIVASIEPLDFPEYLHVDPDDPVPDEPEQPPADLVGYPGDGKDLKPGETIAQRVTNWVKERLGVEAKTKDGAGTSPGRIILSPAEEVAAKLNKRMHDQFEDCDMATTLRQGAFEKVLLGTGLIEGPFTLSKEYPDWDEQGNYTPRVEDMPVYRAVSILDIYPDPNARNQGELDWIIRRRKMSESDLRQLKKNATFRKEAIDRILAQNPNYVKQSFETSIEENSQQVATDRYEVLQYWGTFSKKFLDDQGIGLGFEWPTDVEELPFNVWVCGNEFIRLVINPLVPARLPYYFSPYEFNPYSVFGVGLAENMDDTQVLMNGFMRLAVDNAVLSGSVMLEIDESVLSPGQEYAVESGKIWRKATQTAQASIRPIVVPNTSQQNMQMFDQARRLADEATGIPSFSHGMTGVQGVGRTSSGISMLLGAASLTTKTVVKNADDYWFKPIGRASYCWNMQNKFDPKLRGDISVVARGTANMMQKEMRLQKNTQFAQTFAPIPQASAWINWKELVKDTAQALEVNIEKLLNAPDEYQLQLKLHMLMQQKQQAQQAQAAQGQPAQPGQEGFSGNDGQAGAAVNAQQGAQDGQQGQPLTTTNSPIGQGGIGLS